MSNIRALDMEFLDDLFDMGGGLVLKFSDRTFRNFFAEELNIDIYNPIYDKEGTSKAKRLRYFLQTVDKPTVVRTLDALWEYRETRRLRAKVPETLEDAHGRLLTLIGKLEGDAPRNPLPPEVKVVADRARLQQLRDALMGVSRLDPQPPGYAFEKFLQDLFNVYGLEARAPFRIRGEQIDGSFQLSNSTYLLEARWRNQPCDAPDLRAFHGKLEEKADWARGLYISNSGFTEDGLAAFGRAKRLICMDGLDLYDVLNRELPLDQVLERKVRRAAETGLPFMRVRDLYP